MVIPIYQVDAFTDKPFLGNPAVVCVLTESKDEEWMQLVAREMNLPETAFLYKSGDGFNLRWFTPTTEVDLCGHATLASAHALWEMGYLDRGQEVQFYTKSGLLTARQDDKWIELNFPSEPPIETTLPDFVIQGLNVFPKYTGKNRLDYIVEVESEDIIRNLQPDLNLLKAMDIRGVIVTSLSKIDNFDFVSRFFAPGAGIDEDPVTGSAHCCLGPYWHLRLNKKDLTGYQASDRGGLVKVKVLGDRVSLSGKAVTVLKGELLY